VSAGAEDLRQEDLRREPWDGLAIQREASTFGIWVFLASEALFFGALLLAYTVSRVSHPEAFAAAARETNVWLGTLNTAILLTSSLTMAVASQAAQEESTARGRLPASCLALTAVLGLAFLVVKGFEYAEDVGKGLVPGAHFALPQAASQLFFALYWILTSVHAVHLTLGIVAVSRLAIRGWRAPGRLAGSPQVEVTALYWHLVDVVWIFLYPLLYLADRT
jgi:cytochrome c oxidase subunit III